MGQKEVVHGVRHEEGALGQGKAACHRPYAASGRAGVDRGRNLLHAGQDRGGHRGGGRGLTRFSHPFAGFRRRAVLGAHLLAHKQAPKPPTRPKQTCNERGRKVKRRRKEPIALSDTPKLSSPPTQEPPQPLPEQAMKHDSPGGHVGGGIQVPLLQGRLGKGLKPGDQLLGRSPKRPTNRQEGKQCQPNQRAPHVPSPPEGALDRGCELAEGKLRY